MKRESLPNTRESITHVFRLQEREPDGTMRKVQLYFIASRYPDGRPGEVFIRADKAGSFTAGALEGVAIQLSLGLQYGIPLETLIEKFIGTNFPPNGFTGDPMIPSCSSALDLLAKWLRLKFPAPA